ncbi:MAG: VWA domain-containing protein [Burkholderiales bacterium]|nr:VWA domain-containing protein [Burkholderiales bacterium]
MLQSMQSMQTLLRYVAIASMVLALGACDKKDSADASASANASSASVTYKILAGSELKDVQNMVQEYGRTQNVNIVFDYTGTLDAVDRLKGANDYDAVWLSNGKYLQMQPQLKTQIKASEKIMYSPVVLGVKSSTMQKLGWQSGKTGWTDILKAAKAGQFHFAMTNPAGSNTGFVALVGIAAELSGKGDALEEKDIPVDKLKEFFSAQTMTAGSSGALAEMFAANPRVDGIINYESVIRSMPAAIGLDILVPKEGVITADYPLMQLAQSKQAAFYPKLVAWLRQDATQKQIATTTNRTPLAGNGRNEVINELPFPASNIVVDAILQGFLDSYSRPASSYFVLDVSGSMAGPRLDGLKDTMLSLANGDGSTGGRFASLRAREQIHVLAFSNEPKEIRDYELTTDREKNLTVLSSLSSQINNLKAGGGTAIFSSIASQYKRAQAELRQEERSVSIVLLTDGENTDGMRLEEFRDFIAKMGSPKVPVFAIIYGDAKPSEMTELATLTGGRVFDARKVKLSQVMRDIRNYQ